MKASPLVAGFSYIVNSTSWAKQSLLNVTNEHKHFDLKWLLPWKEQRVQGKWFSSHSFILIFLLSDKRTSPLKSCMLLPSSPWTAPRGRDFSVGTSVVKHLLISTPRDYFSPSSEPRFPPFSATQSVGSVFGIAEGGGNPTCGRKGWEQS